MISSSIHHNTANLYTAIPIGQSQTGPKDPLVQNSSFRPIEPLENSQSTHLRSRDRVAVSESLSEGSHSLPAEATGQQVGADQQGAKSAGDGQRDAKLEDQQAKAVELQEQREISELASRDREVRAHEQAHAAVGGQYAGAPSYEFQRGPDGVSYAVGGEVSIDVGQAATPGETLIKAQTVRRAALAPAEPSPQDRKVAAQASRLESQARTDIASERTEEAQKAKEERAQSSEETQSTSTETGSLAESNVPSGSTLGDGGSSVVSAGSSHISSLETPRVSSVSSSVSNTSGNRHVSPAGERLHQILASTSQETNHPGALLSQIV